jgi:alkaline phosphatase D
MKKEKRENVFKINWSFIFILFMVHFGLCIDSSGSIFESQWNQTFDRVWLGPQYWANPMEDWRVNGGKLECISAGGNRNVHVLTRQLGTARKGFRMSVRLGLCEKGKTGSAGFRIGIHDDINDYRGNVLWGKGIDAGLTIEGQLKVADKTIQVKDLPLDDLILTLVTEPIGSDYELTLAAIVPSSGKQVARLDTKVAAERLVGNLAIVNNFPDNAKQGSRFWFSDWRIEGDKVEAHDDRVFGPILWAMHTLSNSRSKEGYVFKITAEMPPLGSQDNNTVELQVQRQNAWKSLGTQAMDPDAYTATFRIPNWPADRNVPYRLVYKIKHKDGTQKTHYWTGTIRKDPVNKTLVFACMTCQYHYGFPYGPLVKNLAALNPDMLYFSGDQIYEANGHYGIIREPADRAILNYLRKWYLFGWAFGELMRDRPTLCTPDDHDVFQGNLWGNGGNPVPMTQHDAGGYAQPARMVQVVHRTNTSHHPDFFDPTPIKQDIDVYYGDMVYGGVSFAVVSDRMFKSGPRGTVADWPGRPDHVKDENYDVSKLDKPGLKLLGDRQLKFLEHWVEDWRGADMKMLLSQTVFANAATHHGSKDGYLRADLDSNGWPQSGRNRAVKIIRKCFPLHVCGDQHITTLLQHGIDEQRDSNWSLCTPAITVGYQRWWRPDELGREYHHRPSHGLPNTGEYIDPLGNNVYVYTVGNPEGIRDQNRYRQAHIRSSGFSIVRVNHQNRTYTCESYRFLVDVTDDKNEDLFAGFPYTIEQTDNYGRKPFGYLEEYSCDGVDKPVVKVYDEGNRELVYAIRAKDNHFRPWVFGEGTYTVKIGDPDTDKWETYSGQTTRTKNNAAVAGNVYMANGIKIGEVNQNSAIVWTRLTKHKERNIDGLAFTLRSEGVPEGHVLDDMEGSTPGIAGEVRVTYWPEGSENKARSTSWESVDIHADFTRQFKLSDLSAGTTYQLRVQGRAIEATELSCTTYGSFKTAPDPAVPAPVLFTVVTCQEYPRRDDPQNGHKIYSVMRKLEPDFLVHTGDIEYYDRPLPYAKNKKLARFKWNRIYSMPFQRAFHNVTTSYFIKDDHDTLKDDCWPGQTYGDLTWEQGLAIFREQVPMGEKTYRTIRWGRDLQIWIVEGRDFRSPNTMPDGPEKTIWGKQQKQWFFDTVRKSDATYRILISPTPLVGPDRDNKNDNHANKGFTHEGNELREFIGSQKNMYVINGDRHWQYVSVDPNTGVREYGCGPSSDIHAGGYSLSMRKPAHRYLRIKGGFLAVKVERINGEPTVTFRHYGPDGKIYNEDKW